MTTVDQVKHKEQETAQKPEVLSTPIQLHLDEPWMDLVQLAMSSSISKEQFRDFLRVKAANRKGTQDKQ